jgi:hypothetical protein
MTTSCRWPQAEAHFQASRSLLAYDRYLEERQARRFPIDECVLELLTRANDRKGEAFGQLVTRTSFVNAAAGVRWSIAEKIRKHVDEVRKALATIAEGLEAESFGMSASLPVGLSVSLTFKVKPGE